MPRTNNHQSSPPSTRIDPQRNSCRNWSLVQVLSQHFPDLFWHGLIVKHAAWPCSFWMTNSSGGPTWGKFQVSIFLYLVRTSHIASCVKPEANAKRLISPRNRSNIFMPVPCLVLTPKTSNKESLIYFMLIRFYFYIPLLFENFNHQLFLPRNWAGLELHLRYTDLLCTW